ncbi:hypothetical protein M1L60_44990 [Actinoplanes sp. TRM 88003]|uniref:Uncharacterized protein n=1 Tax=Paractinoplanes aksuensis TaxID=2939490 RepID=A0ABT1E3P6_9ACTN|nr:hypothetical protein [Actinoplanes aksuensis]MCO8277754.1 hypothetical protein [Actinoplanes aksuensis]
MAVRAQHTDVLAPNTITEYHEFPGRSHWTCAEPGWEQVADKALDWALTHAR